MKKSTADMNKTIDNFCIRMKNKDFNMYKDFIQNLSKGTSCKSHVAFIEEYKGYLIYHHKSHSDWVGDYNALCKAYLGYIKFNPNLNNIKWMELFFDKSQKIYYRKSQKTIIHIKTLIDSKEFDK